MFLFSQIKFRGKMTLEVKRDAIAQDYGKEK